MSSLMTSERLGSLVAELLESAVFVFAEDIKSTPWDAASLWSAHLELEKDETYQLALCVPKELGLTLAANLLGLEPDEEDAKQSLCDAVGEMANMLAGTVAVELFGKDVVCRIGVPRTMEETGAVHDAHAGKACCRVSLKTDEGQRLDVCVTKLGTERKLPVVGSKDKTPTPTGDTP